VSSGRGGAAGTLPIELLHRLGQKVVLLGKEMAVELEGRADILVSHATLHGNWVGTLIDPQRGGGVPELVPCDMSEL
jgi:hypothetical protein